MVAEGVRDENGKYLFEYTSDGMENPEITMGGITPYLTATLKREFGCKIRGIDMGLMQRCASHATSRIDVEEAVALGRFAVDTAAKGETKKIVAVKRIRSRPYTTTLQTVAMRDVLNAEHALPAKYLRSDGIADEYADYIEPLIGDMPDYFNITIPHR